MELAETSALPIVVLERLKRLKRGFHFLVMIAIALLTLCVSQAKADEDFSTPTANGNWNYDLASDSFSYIPATGADQDVLLDQVYIHREGIRVTTGATKFYLGSPDTHSIRISNYDSAIGGSENDDNSGIYGMAETIEYIVQWGDEDIFWESNPRGGLHIQGHSLFVEGAADGIKISNMATNGKARLVIGNGPESRVDDIHIIAHGTSRKDGWYLTSAGEGLSLGGGIQTEQYRHEVWGGNIVIEGTNDGVNLNDKYALIDASGDLSISAENNCGISRTSGAVNLSAPGAHLTLNAGGDMTIEQKDASVTSSYAIFSDNANCVLALQAGENPDVVRNIRGNTFLGETTKGLFNGGNFTFSSATPSQGLGSKSVYNPTTHKWEYPRFGGAVIVLDDRAQLIFGAKTGNVAIQSTIADADNGLGIYLNNKSQLKTDGKTQGDFTVWSENSTALNKTSGAQVALEIGGNFSTAADNERIRESASGGYGVEVMTASNTEGANVVKKDFLLHADGNIILAGREGGIAVQGNRSNEQFQKETGASVEIESMAGNITAYGEKGAAINVEGPVLWLTSENGTISAQGSAAEALVVRQAAHDDYYVAGAAEIVAPIIDLSSEQTAAILAEDGAYIDLKASNEISLATAGKGAALQVSGMTWNRKETPRLIDGEPIRTTVDASASEMSIDGAIEATDAALATIWTWDRLELKGDITAKTSPALALKALFAGLAVPPAEVVLHSGGGFMESNVSTDGGIVRLNLNNTIWTGASALSTADQLANDTAAGSHGIFAKLDGTSRWNVTKDSALTTLAMTPGTCVDLTESNGTTNPDNEYRTVTVDRFEGNGGTFAMRVDLTSDGQEYPNGLRTNGNSDQLIIQKETSPGENYLSLSVSSSGTEPEEMVHQSNALVIDKSPDKLDNVWLLAGKNDADPGNVLKIDAGNYTYTYELTAEPSELSEEPFPPADGDPLNWRLVLSGRDDNSKDEYSPSAAAVFALAGAGSQAITYLRDLEDLRQRVGEIRNGLEDGFYAQTHGGKERLKGFEGISFHNEYSSFRLGTDHYLKEYGWIVGANFTYTDGDQRVRHHGVRATGESQNYSGQAHATWFDDNGSYADIVFTLSNQHQHLKTHMLDGTAATGDYRMIGYGLSSEAGRKLLFGEEKTWFVEPQAQLAFFQVRGDEFTMSNGMKVEQQNEKSLTGRLGLVAGRSQLKENKTGVQYFAKVGVKHDFFDDPEIIVNSEKFSGDGLGTRLYYGVGLDWFTSEKTRFYTQLEREQGADYVGEFNARIGVKHDF